MAERTYMFGYSGARVTLAQLNAKWTWVNLHPEIQRRHIAMWNDQQDAGFDAGIGEGARSYDLQRRTFLARHTQVASGGCCSYLGKRYQLTSGAHAAPPGQSVHEDDLYEGYALAVDNQNWTNHWLDANCSRYGLKNFGGKIGPNVNNEEWHTQPVEFANSRSAILVQIQQGIRLMRWPLPGEITPPEPAPLPPPVVDPVPPPVVIQEDDEMRILIIKDVRAPFAQWKTNGVTKTWIKDGDMAAQIDMRLSECANGTKPSPVDGFIYKQLNHGSNDVIASYGPIEGPKPGAPFDDYGRLL